MGTRAKIAPSDIPTLTRWLPGGAICCQCLPIDLIDYLVGAGTPGPPSIAHGHALAADQNARSLGDV